LAESSIKKLNSVGGVCSHCQQKVDQGHIKAEIATLTLKLDALWAAGKEVSSERNELNVLTNEVEVKLLEQQQREIRVKGDLNSLTNEISYVEREIKKIELDIKQAKEAKNEFAGLVATKDAELEEIEANLAGIEGKVEELTQEHAAVYYWVAGFKRLRLYIVEETLRSLEIEVNNNLASLGLINWRIEFDIERENKSGSVTKGFTVLIYDPSGKSHKYETFSGGETQLLRLAGSLGLANLIMERAGLINKQEFYDEPSSHLSKEAVANLCETLQQRAESTNRQIWLVDHTALDFGGFKEVLTVTKGKQGSTIGG
jgi:DNA repair exonuclease SbcCD ATPase subunit